MQPAPSSKASTPAEKPKSESAAKDKKAKAAPRPRKWDYGISDDAKIVLLKDEANVKSDIKKDWELLGKTPITCKAFFEKGGTRHGLRVMSRRKLVNVVHANGTKYPIEYTKPVKKAPEPKAK